MKKLLSLLIVGILLAIPFALATSTSTSVGISITPGNSAPQVWQDASARHFYDVFGNLLTRTNNYGFTGESLEWTVLARDANGVGDMNSPEVTIEPVSGSGTTFTTSCDLISPPPYNNGDPITWADGGLNYNELIDEFYKCRLTITPSMVGEYNLRVKVTDKDGDSDTINENSVFYLNPSISLEILNADNGLQFGSVQPGQVGYSQPIQVKNTAVDGSGVVLEVKISGTDFYGAPGETGTCPTSNVLELSNFRYLAEKGSYSSRANTGTGYNVDSEGYDIIPYPNSAKKIIKQDSKIAPGADIAVAFKLDLPQPCSIGSFTSGSFNFEGTAI